MTIHWCGTGLSSGPGLRRLFSLGLPVVVWNRTVANAKAVVGDLTDDIRPLDLAALEAAVNPGDIVVSMLPADQHLSVAQCCLRTGSHFVSSSYIAPEMRALDAEFRAQGLVSINEVGLDPGIDHLMAHDLVHRYRASGHMHPDNEISFTSYCGGVPKIPNAFTYKFSWAPLGVLKALRSPSRSLVNFSERIAQRPWHAVSAYDAPLPQPETFEVYPNRDSYPFLEEYRFDPDWKVRDFVRGTIRLNGWAAAWTPVFTEIETLHGPEGDARLSELSAELLANNSYARGEPDRVVLFVSLKARRGRDAGRGRAVNGGIGVEPEVEQPVRLVHDETWAMDAWGDERGSAMGRLVSVPVSIAIQSLLDGQIGPGVHAAPNDPALVSSWLEQISPLAQYMQLVVEQE